MKFIEEIGDLFDLDDHYSLAHCISADVTATNGMGAGIAKQFRRIYSAMASTIASQLHIGRATRYQYKTEIVYNLVTKRIYSQKALGSGKMIYYHNLQAALEDLRDQMIMHHELWLGMPRIGCGLDGCDWDEIRTMIQTVFAATAIQICIRYLE